MKRLIFIFLFSVLSPASELGMQLLPKGRPFRLTFADPREIRMALSFEGDSRLHASIGNYFSIFALRPVDSSTSQFHFGLEGGGFFTMKQADHRFPLETADGLLGLYSECNFDDIAIQLRFTHISAHLADGSTGQAIAYSRESLIARLQYLPSNELQIYSGVSYLVNSVPNVAGWGIQWGGAYFLPLGGTKIVPFTAADIKWKQESEANPSFSFQLGIALNNPPEAYRSFRFFYSYFTGSDPRGQFYRNSITAQSIGIEMQI